MAFAFTSVGCNIVSATGRSGSGPSSFMIHGELYHLQGPINHIGNSEVSENRNAVPSYAQLYIYDPAFGVNNRVANNPDLNVNLIEQLTNMLHTDNVNPFVNIYKHAHEILKDEYERQASNEEESTPFHIRLSPQMTMELVTGNDRRTENLPTTSEIAAVIPTEFAGSSFRDIKITYRNGIEHGSNSFKRINQTHAAFMPLHYVLLFPRGDYGWHWGLRLSAVNLPNSNVEVERQRNRLPQRAYYRFRLHSRANEFPTLFLSKRLFQQYVVDVWAVCDQNKLEWIRDNQSNLRADVYNGLTDALAHDNSDLSTVGTKFILPSSYTGGPRFMAKIYQVSMAIERHFGKPTFFITFTANPKWEEITNELIKDPSNQRPMQTAADRPDLVARVFNLKLREFLHDLKKKKIFGDYKGLIRTIEYQKRGLPHCHLLLFLEGDDSVFRDPEKIDEVICAELPSDDDPELLDLVSGQMMHGPCGNINPKCPCMAPDAYGVLKCSKSFPKPFQPTTAVMPDSYPLYRRRLDGRSHRVQIKDKETNGMMSVYLTNQHVVPYNPFLTKKYKAHINVELCGSIDAIKYINKYVYKGPDRTTVHLKYENDEIERYLTSRYIGPTEAVWRLFEYPMHEEDPSVTSLAIHLENEQPVYFDPESNAEEIQQTLDNTYSTLMGFFKYNLTHDDGRNYLYQEFPSHYIWKNKERIWQARKKGYAVGRMYYCTPTAGERFFLRLLLTVVRGPTSFENLKTVNGVVYSTFRAACQALHLIEDDQEWFKCFSEAVEFVSGSSLRSLFVSALLFQELNEPKALWDRFCLNICDDLDIRIAQLGLLNQLCSDDTSNAFHQNLPKLDYGLYLLEQALIDAGKTLADFNMP